jgi:hypothetical protein
VIVRAVSEERQGTQNKGERKTRTQEFHEELQDEAYAGSLGKSMRLRDQNDRGVLVVNTPEGRSFETARCRN